MKNNKIEKAILLFMVACVIFSVAYATTFSSTFDTATPLGSDAPSVIDNRIREVKSAVQERENVNHYWPLTGTQVSDTDAGMHRFIDFECPNTTPAAIAANQARLYTKDANSIAELHFIDEDENEVQITSGGELLATSLGTDWLATSMVKDANITLEKIDFFLDEDDMNSNSATDVASQQSIKKYVDDQVTAVATASGSCKGWAYVATNGTINDSFNVSGVVRNSAGNYTISWTVDFASANYVVVGTPSTVGRNLTVDSQAVGSIVVITADGGNPLDNRFGIAAFGDQ